MGQFSQQVAGLTSRVFARAVTEQGGVISGDNPATFIPTDPIRLWIIQLIIIMAMTQFLSMILGRIRQPRVIAEVIGGIILGPTVMGRIPGFRDAIFPESAMPGLNLTSTIGLVLFLFLVGLEIDTKVIKRNLASAGTISVAGLILPLGLGAALGVGLYKEFVDPSINFGYFLLFTAVAVGITAFPVLCRILTELKLLDTTVGVVTLAAGVGNDVVGWILLALVVALVNASSGLTALYVLLACVGYVIFLLYPGRWAFVWAARRTGSLEQGSPTYTMMTITLLVVFVSAFFTDIIGVHAIFGGFLAGLIIPHENGFAISLVEKLEDLVAILFIPIYFTLSGLRTNLGLMDNAITWGYTIIICLVSFFSKFVGCYVAARTTGFNWREAGAIGSLMSCKGLVELIVLNIGLSAGILDTRSFSMFVVHALILTFMTTPLTLFFYPPKYRTRDLPLGNIGGLEGANARPSSEDENKTRFAIILDKIEQLPAAMTISQLLQSNRTVSAVTSLTSIDEKEILRENNRRTPFPDRQITINALRLIELTNRTSAVLKSKAADSLIHNDPVVSVFKTFGYLNRLLVSAVLSVVNYDEFPGAIATHAMDSDSQMVILPWSRGATTASDEAGSGSAHNPFDGIFHKTTTQDQTSSVVYSEFIRKVFLTSTTNVALFVDRGINAQYAGPVNQHLFLPFFGGPDDRLALSFIVQDLSPSTTNLEDLKSPNPDPSIQTLAAVDTVYGQQTSNIDTSTSAALSRIQFHTTSSSKPLHTIVDLVSVESQSKNVIVLAGRSRRMATESHKVELQNLISESGASIGSLVTKTLGDVGAALVAKGTSASLLILQAPSSS